VFPLKIFEALEKIQETPCGFSLQAKKYLRKSVFSFGSVFFGRAKKMNKLSIFS
jgi:hypothetical protein